MCVCLCLCVCIYKYIMPCAKWSIKNKKRWLSKREKQEIRKRTEALYTRTIPRMPNIRSCATVRIYIRLYVSAAPSCLALHAIYTCQTDLLEDFSRVGLIHQPTLAKWAGASAFEATVRKLRVATPGDIGDGLFGPSSRGFSKPRRKEKKRLLCCPD